MSHDGPRAFDRTDFLGLVGHILNKDGRQLRAAPIVRGTIYEC